MKLISWNVNGLRSILAKGFARFVQTQAPDVICLQESRCEPHQIELDLPGYEAHWNAAEKKGYSGTLTLTRTAPLSVSRGVAGAPDTEGRVLNVELPAFHLVNAYFPNSQRSLERLPFRVKWDAAFRKHLKQLSKAKPVVFCGDLNVAHTELDLANPKANKGTHGFTDEERGDFSQMLKDGYLDSFRLFETGGGHYSWWSQRPGIRARNIGWRLDYFVVSKLLAPKVRSARILADVMGSDHAPVLLELDI
jgi:exodeoxyribonuclease-3